MIDKYVIDCFLARLSSSERFDKHDFEETKRLIDEGMASRSDLSDLEYYKGLLDLSSKVRDFVMSLELEG